MVPAAHQGKNENCDESRWCPGSGGGGGAARHGWEDVGTASAHCTNHARETVELPGRHHAPVGIRVTGSWIIYQGVGDISKLTDSEGTKNDSDIQEKCCGLFRVLTIEQKQIDYLGTRTWIIWHHLPDLSNSLRSGRCHSGLSRVRARISRAGRATGRWGRVRLCATHRPRPEAGPCGLPPCCIDKCVQRVGARWVAQAGGGRAIFRGAAQKA